MLHAVEGWQGVTGVEVEVRVVQPVLDDAYECVRKDAGLHVPSSDCFARLEQGPEFEQAFPAAEGVLHPLRSAVGKRSWLGRGAEPRVVRLTPPTPATRTCRPNRGRTFASTPIGDRPTYVQSARLPQRFAE